MARARILIVEDEPIIREMMAEVLLDAGYDVTEAEDADEAVRLIDADGYKVLVTDIHMPGALDGIGVAEHAHEREPDLPVVFVSARPDVLKRVAALGLRGVALPKPFQLARLVEAVDALLSVEPISGFGPPG